MAGRLPAATFAECAKPCLIVALDLSTDGWVVLKKSPLAQAVRASGAVPILFAAVEIGGHLLVDGGLIVCDQDVSSKILAVTNSAYTMASTTRYSP